MSDLAEIKVSAIDQASAVLAQIKGKADDLSKSADGVKSSWNGGLMEGFTKGGALAAVGAIGAVVAAVGAAGAYFYSLTKAVMEAQAGLKKMSEVTGATVEGLSAIRTVAKLTGIDMEAVSGGLTKLAKNVETGGAATETALKAIGLSLKEMQGLKTDEQFMKITRALDGYADGAGKTAAAQMLLGKSGAQLLPLMRDISEAGDLVVKTTASQAKQADDLEKNIMRLTLAKQAWKKVVGTELVPVLDDVVTVLLKVQTETNGTLAASKKLAADGSIKTWAQDAALAGAAAIDFAFTWIGAMKLMGTGVASFGAGLVSVQADVIAKLTSLTPFVRGETAKMAQAAQENSDKMKASFKTALDSFVNTDTEKYTNKLKTQFAESAKAAKDFAENMRYTGDGAKKPITGLGEAVSDVSKKVEKLGALIKAMASLEIVKIQVAFDIDNNKIKAQISELQEQLQKFGGTDISEAITQLAMSELAAFEKNAKDKLAIVEKTLATLKEKIGDVSDPINVAPEKRDLMMAYLAEQEKSLKLSVDIAGVEDKTNKIRRDGVAVIEAQTKTILDGLARAKYGADDYITGLKEAEELRTLEIQLIGKTTLEQDILKSALAAEFEIRKLNVEITRVQNALSRETNKEQREILDAEIAGLELRIKARKAVEDAAPGTLALKQETQNLADAWKSASETATNFFTDLFTNGKSAFGNLWKTVKKFFIDLAAQFATKFVINAAMGAMGVGASVASAATGGAESSLFGGILSTVGSSVGTWLGGLQSAFAPTTVMTAMTTAWATGSAAFAGGASLISSIGVGLVAMGPVGWVALAVVAVVAALGLSKDELGIKIDNNLTNVGNDPSHFHKNALSDYDVSGDLPDKVFEVLFKAVDKIDKTLVDGLISAETTAAIRAKLNKLINPEWIGFDDQASAAKAIAGASKEFLVARYSTVFSEIDERIAATIRDFGGNAEELLTYIAGVVSVMDTLQKNAKQFTALIGETVDLGQISALSLEGETLAQTLGRVITVFTVTNAVAALMGKDTASAFGVVGLASLKARENLIELAGGMQALGAMTQSFYDKYYSDDERAAITLKNNNAAINATFKDLGISIPQTTAEFRALVEAQDLSTDAGMKTWAALMKVGDAFYAVNGAVDKTTGALVKLATLPDSYLSTAARAADGTARVTDKGAARNLTAAEYRQLQIDRFNAASPSLQSLIGGSSGRDTRTTPPEVVNQALIDATTARRNLESVGAMVLRMTAQQSNGVLAAYNSQRSSLQDLMNIAPRSAGALSAVTAGMYSMRDATAALLMQIKDVKTSINGMFGDTVTSLKLSTMTNEQKYAYYQKDAEEARRLSLTATDPLEIKRLAERVNRDVMAAQGLLTPEQQAQTNPEQIANLEKFNQELQDWLDKQAKVATDANDAFLAKLDAKLVSIIAAQEGIQKKNNDAADKQLIAATTPRRFEVDFSANVPGSVRTSEVGG